MLFRSFGKYEEKVVSNVFHQGRTYTFKLAWQGSKNSIQPADPSTGAEAEGPDYDYHFVVQPQGAHGGTIMDGYDVRAGKFEIGRKLLDPQDVDPSSDDDDDVPDLPTYFGNIRTVFRTLLGGKLITPGGDPVASPMDGGDGANEFTFSAANPGVLTINFKAKPADGAPLM